jgi:hypothetical protein
MLALATAVPSAVAQPKHEKTVTNLDGGVPIDAAGAIPGGACFDLKGRLDAPDFFDNLKREDTVSGTLFRRGNEVVTEFPKQLQLTIAITDTACETALHPSGPRLYLTDNMVRTLRLSFYWKRQLEMRAAHGIVMQDVEVSPIAPIFEAAPERTPQRYEWLLKFEVPSEGVPLTDSLVLIIRSPDHRIIARTAARL